MRIEAIHISPVKSLALVRVERAQLGPHGIVDDRRFFVVSDRDRLITQRECGSLAQVRAEYTIEPECLRLTFPGGAVADAAPADGAAITSRFFGTRDVAGHVVEGPWAAALSSFTGMDLRLVRAERHAFDGFPVSILSTASVDALRSEPGAAAIDERRFRPNFYVSGVADAFGEDAWIGGDVRIGETARVRGVMRDPRCVITTLDPDTGERDLRPMLRMISDRRGDASKEINFGVYAGVVTPGEVAVGDEIVPIEREEKEAS